MRCPDPRRLLAVGCLLLAGCNDTRDLAPPSPDQPWPLPPTDGLGQPAVDRPPGSSASTSGVRQWDASRPSLDPAHQYSLLDLIDLAERRNARTRIAWEQARQAAIAVGEARAAYLPSITASALAGYERIASPFPSNLVARGYITAQAQEVLPKLALRYLLLDFGARDARVHAAQALSVAANVSFSGVHQTLILETARAYYGLDAANAALRASRQMLDSDRLLQRSAKAHDRQGLGTVVEVALAQRGVAQAQYDVAAATTAQHQALDDLLATLDLPPESPLQIVDSSARPLPPDLGGQVDQLMATALRQRPDLIAGVARLEASEAAVAEARAAFEPTLSLDSNVEGNVGHISVDGGRYQSVSQPQAGVFLDLHWPLFEGGLLRNQLHAAQSQAAQAQDALDENRTQAMREVAVARDEVETSLSRYAAARALQAASGTAAGAARQAYLHGVGTLTDAVDTEATLASARATAAGAHAQVLSAAASLAYAAGLLTSIQAPALQALDTREGR